MYRHNERTSINYTLHFVNEKIAFILSQLSIFGVYFCIGSFSVYPSDYCKSKRDAVLKQNVLGRRYLVPSKCFRHYLIFIVHLLELRASDN